MVSAVVLALQAIVALLALFLAVVVLRATIPSWRTSWERWAILRRTHPWMWLYAVIWIALSMGAAMWLLQYLFTHRT